jgi:hypothetical protein
LACLTAAYANRAPDQAKHTTIASRIPNLGKAASATASDAAVASGTLLAQAAVDVLVQQFFPDTVSKGYTYVLAAVLAQLHSLPTLNCPASPLVS